MGSESTRKVDIRHGTDYSEDVDDENEPEIKYAEEDDTDDYKDLCRLCFNKCMKNGVHMATRLPCGHVFGFSCICRWVTKSGKCPVCTATCCRHQMIGVYQSLEPSETSSSTSMEEDQAPGMMLTSREQRRDVRAATKTKSEDPRLNPSYGTHTDANRTEEAIRVRSSPGCCLCIRLFFVVIGVAFALIEVYVLF